MALNGKPKKVFRFPLSVFRFLLTLPHKPKIENGTRV